MSTTDSTEKKALAKFPQGTLGAALFVAGWCALLASLWYCLPLFGNVLGITDYDSAGVGMVALFFGLPTMLVAVGLFSIGQAINGLASRMGALGLRAALTSLGLSILAYWSGAW